MEKIGSSQSSGFDSRVLTPVDASVEHQVLQQVSEVER
jgi:hypothetical protein